MKIGNFDPRTRVILIIGASILFGVSSSIATAILLVMAVIISCFYHELLLINLRVILFTIIWLTLMVVLAWLLGFKGELNVLIHAFIRWTSFIIISIVLFSSLNAFELVKALVFFRIHKRFALSVGVGVRYIPLFVQDATEVYLETRKRDIWFNRRALERYGFFGILGRVLSPLIIVAIRRMENTWLSVVIHQLEDRITVPNFPILRNIDWLMISMTGAGVMFCIVEIFWK